MGFGPNFSCVAGFSAETNLTSNKKKTLGFWEMGRKCEYKGAWIKSCPTYYRNFVDKTNALLSGGVAKKKIAKKM